MSLTAAVAKCRGHVLAVGAAALVGAGFAGCSPPGSGGPPNVTSAGRPHVTATLDVGPTPGVPVPGDGFVWLPDPRGYLLKISPDGHRIVDRILVGDAAAAAGPCSSKGVHQLTPGSFLPRRCDVPIATAVAPNAVWLIRNDIHGLARIDPATDRVVASIPLGIEGWHLFATSTDVWVTSYFEGEVVHVDARSSAVLARIALPVGPTDVLVAFGSVWVTDSRHGTLVRIDPQTNRVLRTITLGREGDRPVPLVAALGRVWVRNESGREIVAVDPVRDAVIARAPAPLFYGADGMDSIGFDGRRLWLSSLRVTACDASTGRVVETLSHTGIAVDFGLGALWAVDIGGPLYRYQVS